MVDQWLVRTAENLVIGPYSKDQLVQMIMEHKIGFQDEVCRANHYWFYLHEQDEVSEQLGIDIKLLPKSSLEEDDSTQTDIRQTSHAAIASKTRSTDESEIPLPELAEDVQLEEQDTQMISNLALKKFQPKTGPVMDRRIHTPSIRGKFESESIIKVIVIVIVVTMVLLVAGLIEITRRGF